jgi:hypothetical protein
MQVHSSGVGTRPARTARTRARPSSTLEGVTLAPNSPRARFGPLAALLVAHVQTGKNRALRGLGRYGAVGLAFVILLPLSVGGVMGVLCAIIGGKLGRHIDLPEAPIYLGGFVAIMTFAFGFMGGILGGTRQLTWEAYKSYPVPFRTLFFAEIAASVGDVLVLVYLALNACMGLAFVRERPDLAPWLLLLLGQATLWVLFTQQIIGALAIAVVKRLRVAFLAVMLSTWIGLSYVGRAAAEFEENIRRDRIEELRRWWDMALPWLESFPLVRASYAVRLASRGEWFAVGQHEVPLLCFTTALGLSTYLLLRREAGLGSTLAGGTWGARSSRWRTAGAVGMIARLQLHHLLTSLQGRFGLVIPIVTVVLIKGPLAGATAGTAWVIPGAVTYLAISAGQLQFNQFGLDGQGIKTLLLLPVTMREILVGKALAMAAYSLTQYAILFALLSWTMHPGASDLVGGGLLAGCLLVTHLGEGHWISAILPRAVPFHRIQAGGLQVAHLFPLVLGAANATAFGGAYGALHSWAPRALVPTMAAAFALVLLAYAAALPRAARFVTRQREKLVEVLG